MCIGIGMYMYICIPIYVYRSYVDPPAQVLVHGLGPEVTPGDLREHFAAAGDIYMCVYVYVCVCIYIYMYIFLSLSLSLYIYIYL